MTEHHGLAVKVCFEAIRRELPQTHFTTSIQVHALVPIFCFLILRMNNPCSFPRPAYPIAYGILPLFLFKLFTPLSPISVILPLMSTPMSIQTCYYCAHLKKHTNFLKQSETEDKCLSLRLKHLPFLPPPCPHIIFTFLSTKFQGPFCLCNSSPEPISSKSHFYLCDFVNKLSLIKPPQQK